MLRRYGEQALRDVGYFTRWRETWDVDYLQDIRNLLADWAHEIHDCERIFIRASMSNRRIFLDYESAVIEKGISHTGTVLRFRSRSMAGDERLRGFPFPTRRPVCTASHTIWPGF